MSVHYNGHFYTVGDFSFDEADRDLAYIDRALESWTAWREYVRANMMSGNL